MKTELLCGAPCTLFDLAKCRDYSELSAIAETLFDVHDSLSGCFVLTHAESVEIWNYSKFCDIEVFLSGETFNLYDIQDLGKLIDSLPSGFSFSYLSYYKGQIVLKFCYHFS